MSRQHVNGARRKTESSDVGPSVEEDVLAALTEFTDALKVGDAAKQLTRRQVALDLERTAYGPELVKQTREILRLSQSLFARFLGVSPQTVRSWEQGASKPSQLACRFMDEIRRDPAYWAARLKTSTVTRIGAEQGKGR